MRFVILGFLNPYHWDVKVLIDEFAEWKDFESLPPSESFSKEDQSARAIYNPELYFDMRGSLMMMSFLNYHLELEKFMWILSTFGGAFSAYGDYNEDFAVKASAISVKQLEIAMKLGNPVLISRCKLYLSLSLIQRGYFRLAKRIIREQFKLWEKVEVSDGNLIRKICRGIWTRLNNEKRRHMHAVQ
ncbi:Uncharacterized protein TSPI_01462 [Trichinella spiralis]|uniref:Uncharacterized protein n=1 Tax=Trichinella spiralis TaxID=6334 RepID=A0ABR3KJ14_TRISP